MAYEPDVTAFWSAVLAATKAPLAYDESAATLIYVVFANAYAELAYEPALTPFWSAVLAAAKAALAYTLALVAVKLDVLATT